MVVRFGILKKILTSGLIVLTAEISGQSRTLFYNVSNTILMALSSKEDIAIRKPFDFAFKAAKLKRLHIKLCTHWLDVIKNDILQICMTDRSPSYGLRLI